MVNFFVLQEPPTSATTKSRSLLRAFIAAVRTHEVARALWSRNIFVVFVESEEWIRCRKSVPAGELSRPTVLPDHAEWANRVAKEFESFVASDHRLSSVTSRSFATFVEQAKAFDSFSMS